MKLYKYLLVLSIPVVLGVSCKKSLYVKANEDPSTLTSVDPGDQFLYAASNFANSFEAYYDYYRAIMPWMQYSTGTNGNPQNFTNISGNFDYRYGNYYGNVGLALADIPHLIANMTPAQQAARQYEAAIASIYMAYYTFYTSDINGSIPYSQAFQARYGGTFTPVYDTQQSIFDTLDTQIKNAVAVLESSPSAAQTLYGGNDPFFGTSSNQALEWAKAGNALRLKIAMRQININPSTVQTIAQSVLADANQMSSISDSWVLYVGNAFAVQGGNFDPTGFLASAPVVNFMNTTGDPRLGIYYRKNSSGVYLGSPTDPDTCSSQFYQNLYKAADTPFSQVQHRLFTPDYNENDGFGAGSGTGFYPALTYAEYCFIRAYLGAKGLTSDDPGTWYNSGVTASIEFYSQQAVAAGISGFTPVAAGQITTYLTQPGVTFVTANAAEQIACQAYLEFYRQPSEGWAWWKMTGYPNTTSVIAWSPLTSQGTPNVLNRRAALTVLPSSDANYANQAAAYTQMATNPLFGSSPSDAAGRVWWDVLP
jgi:Starch-binding associating with outer membrane